MPRRSFLKTTLAAGATGALATSPLAAQSAAAASDREFYELRCYRLQAGTRLKQDPNAALLDGYLEGALLPALDALGVKNVGAFTELEVDKAAGTRAPKAGSPVWVLLTHANLASYVQVNATLTADAALQQKGGAYLKVPKATPAFERIDSWLYLAFKSMPKMEIPAFSRSRAPGRVFEMRDYESHSELAALNKMAMFDDGETQLMRDLAMHPTFFGQGIAGPNLPHLRYFTGGPDLATHLAAWAKFGPDPRWQKMRVDPIYADNTSLNTARFLTPKAYSAL
ncbi:MAG TPA: hypothetical protein VGD88_13970 [Opitutaceae bacterium]